MANFLYDDGRQGFLDGSIDWDTDDIRVVGCTSSYTAVQASHTYLSDITAGYRVSTSSALTGKTATDGIADADDAQFTSVSGSAISQFVGYKHTGTDGTARLIFKVDTYTGLPYTPTGGNLVVVWPSGTNKIFKL